MNNPYLVKIASSTEEIRRALEIRRLVFIDEQNIPAQIENDNNDETALHAVCLIDHEIVATGRLVIEADKKGVLARIAVLPEYRGKGLGQLIVKQLEQAAIENELRELSLQPHAYLEKFYHELGYEKVPGESVVGEHLLITMKKSLLDN